MHRSIFAVAAAATLSACGAADINGGNVLNGIDVDDLSFVGDEVASLAPVPFANLPAGGSSRFDGYFIVDKLFDNGDAVGELVAQVDFGEAKVLMTTGDVDQYEDRGGAFVRRISGGLAMTDGTISEATTGTGAIFGTLTGSIEGAAIRANIGAGFVGEGGRTLGFSGGSRAGSSHEVSVFALDR